ENGAIVTGAPAGVVGIFQADAFDRLVINGNSGGDIIDASALSAGKLQLTLNGGLGNDTFFGSQGSDTVVGGDGDDLAFLGAGDMAHADATDRLTILGNGGNDTINASALAAGRIALTLDGGEGNDILLGSQGADRILGGNGNDIVAAGRGDDVALLGADDDTF